MPTSLRLAPKRGLIAALTGCALLLAACGADPDTAVESGAEAPASTEAEAAAPAESSTTAADSESADSESADSESVEEEASTEEAESGSGQEASEEEASEEEASDEAPADNFFPDIEVLSVADGSNVNLADELGGGDLPVLLWFWAPH